MATEPETLTSCIGIQPSRENIARNGEVVFASLSQKQLAWLDFKEGFFAWRIWLMLAYQDIKLRYRRSVLGPFWITISMAITVYSMGYLYSHLFHQPLEQYYPYLVAGMLTWTLISTAITDLTEGFTAAEGLIKQIKLPYTLYMHRLAARNILIFFHNIFVMVPIFLIFPHTLKPNWHLLLIIPGLIIIYFNAIIYGLIIAMIGGRYRDIAQIIKSLIQVIFFITPVMWGPEVLGVKHRYVADFNPLYSFIELIRAPLLGNLPTLKNFAMVLLVSAFGVFIGIKMFTRYRSRIVYWL